MKDTIWDMTIFDMDGTIIGDATYGEKPKDWDVLKDMHEVETALAFDMPLLRQAIEDGTELPGPVALMFRPVEIKTLEHPMINVLVAVGVIEPGTLPSDDPRYDSMMKVAQAMQAAHAVQEKYLSYDAKPSKLKLVKKPSQEEGVAP